MGYTARRCLKTIRFFLLICPILAVLQLLNLFFLHFDGSVQTHSFAHGFKETYSTEVLGLDPVPLTPIFSEPFSFLGQGKQMTAFVSYDGQYVLKVFNPMRPLKKEWYKKGKYWKRYSSLKWIKREWFTKEARLQKLFTRHKLAYEKLRKETGLLYVHLAPSTHLNQSIRIKDKEGKEHILSLSKTPFVLQKKAILAHEHLSSLLSKGERKRARKAVASMEQLFQTRTQKGITDRIQTMENNYGFVGDLPIQIDVGRIVFDETLSNAPERETNRVINDFRIWTHKTFPQL